MQLFAFGVNHETAPLTVREQLVFHAETLTQALRDLVAYKPVREAAIISTCNRTEVYCATAEPGLATAWLAGYHRLKPSHIEPYLYKLPQEQAVKHAFRVASGLDSLVLGEPQILGQFKEAVRTAQAAGTLGWLLSKLFQRTFSVAKAVRSETEIGASRVSMASAAVELARARAPVRGALPGRDDRAQRIARAARRARYRGRLHREPAAAHRQGHRRERVESAQAPAHAHVRSRRAA